MPKAKTNAPAKAEKARGKTRSLFIPDPIWQLLTEQAESAQRTRSGQIAYLLQQEEKRH